MVEPVILSITAKQIVDRFDLLPLTDGVYRPQTSNSLLILGKFLFHQMTLFHVLMKSGQQRRQLGALRADGPTGLRLLT